MTGFPGMDALADPERQRAYRPGFAAPVLDAQACFRALLEAQSRPGSVHQIAAAPMAPPLDPATAAVLLTLVDADTRLWLDASLAPAGAWLAFQAGARQTGMCDAAFAVACALPLLADLCLGTDAEPEQGATLVLQLPSLTGGTRLTLSGPGLETTGILEAKGLPRDFVAHWAANHALFPRGVDIVLCAGHAVCVLPRSTQVHQECSAAELSIADVRQKCSVAEPASTTGERG